MRLTKISCKKCPKDGTFTTYDTKHPDPNAEYCISNIPGKGKEDRWWCSRPKNHEGLHHAHFYRTQECFATWTTEEAVVEAL